MSSYTIHKKIGPFPVDGLLIVLLLGVQFIFWNGIKFGEEDNETIIWKGTSSVKPDMEIVPEPPTPAAVKALSWGDEEFYFRMSALTIQNAGDTFGRTTALTDYNYEKLYAWWKILDSLNPTSDFVPPLASYYYGSSKDGVNDIPYVVKYLREHASADPLNKWWWYSQAVYHAKHKMNDLDLALEIAEEMAERVPEEAGAPLWIRQMPAFIYEAKGEYNASCNIILNIIKNQKDVKEGEMNFMAHFLLSRVKEMAEADDEKLEGLNPQCRAIVDAKKQEILELRAKSQAK
jgi:hypothetical protein